MYGAIGTGGSLAATGFALLQLSIGAWVLIVAGLALMTILPRMRRKIKKH